MGRGVNTPWRGGSQYHWYGGQNTMGRAFDIPWVGGRYTTGRGRCTMGSRVNIPWVGDTNTMNRMVKISSVGGRYVMGRGFKVPWVKGSICHG